MAENALIINRPNSSSPPPNCAICLGSFTNKCFSDSCMHQFCFKCLLEWSKIKAECPLCKQPFRRIIHNVKSNNEYDEHVVEITPPEQIHIIDNEEFLFLPLGNTPQPSTRHHFHFRTTFTVDTRGEHAIQQMLLSHPLTNGGQISMGAYPPSRNMYHRRRRDNNSASFRRSIYTRNLWVNAPPDVTGRYRDVSPAFFRSCPGARTRLVPWLNRELQALLYENTQLIMHLVDLIMEHLLRHHICSRTFRYLLYEYLDAKTDHFVHEFYNFMRSPFDMIGYDRHVVYTERPRSPPPYLDVLQDDDSVDDDSDVIIVGSSNPQQPDIIDLVEDTDSDEPIFVSQEGPMPTPVPERSFSTVAVTQTTSDEELNVRDRGRRDRAPLLPLKLRLKRKRQSREHKERLRRRKRKRDDLHSRSRSSSSESSCIARSPSNSSRSSSEDTYKRYKRKKKLKRPTKKRHNRRSSSEKHVNVDDSQNSNTDDNLPLSSLAAANRKNNRPMLKEQRNSYTPPHPFTCSLANVKEHSENSSTILQDFSDVPGCSSSDPVNGSRKHNLDQEKAVLEMPKEPGTRPPSTGKFPLTMSSSDSVDKPSCSKYDSSPSYRNRIFNANVIRSEDESSNNDTPLQHLFVNKKHKEVKTEVTNSGGPSNSNNNVERLRNILLKKEESSNMWYSYPCDYNSDSSDF